jgi:hypothetical protein
LLAGAANNQSFTSKSRQAIGGFFVLLNVSDQQPDKGAVSRRLAYLICGRLAAATA